MASIERDIVEWAQSRPAWQRNLIARIARGVEVSSEDVATLAEQLVAASVTLEEPVLELKHIPTGNAANSRVGLIGIGNLANVNALLPDQKLTFGALGLTVIYGDNGSGKSGYARLAKELVGARHAEAILPDAYGTKSGDQSADIEYTVDGIPANGAWPALSDPLLRGVHFYDEACGDVYLVSETELSYRPSVLRIFDRLIQLTDDVRVSVDGLIADNLASSPALPVLTAGTKAHEFLGGLSEKTTNERVDDFLVVEEGSEETLAGYLLEEARLKGTDPGKERLRLYSASKPIDELASLFDSIQELLSPAASNALESLKQSASDLREAAKLASSESFASEPVVGVGSDAWRVLWEAARRFSEEDAYPGHDFPRADPSDRCVLCQQPLGQEAGDRLRRFHAFVHNDVEKRAVAAEKAYSEAVASVAALNYSAPSIAQALNFLRTDDSLLADSLEKALEIAKLARERMSARLKGETEDEALDLQAVDTDALRTLSVGVATRAASIDDEAFKKSLAGVVVSKDELSDLILLTKAKPDVMAELARLKEAASLRKVRGSLSTGPMTTKATDLMRRYVTQAVSDKFVRESENLKLDHVVLGDKGGGKGKLRHKPALLGAAGSSPSDVLSEGEQTAAGLAGLFTEIAFDESKSTIVLDDPVSSLDHQRRDRAAMRIAQLSTDRQVIVFTHDLMFLGELIKRAEEFGVILTERAIERDGTRRPGRVIETLPWKAKDVKARLNELTQRLAALKKEQPNMSAEDYELRSSDFAGKMSETWERLVRSEVVNRVVDRGTSEVRPKMFRLLANITSEDDTAFQAGYGQVSKWARRHDKSEEVNYTAPSIEELNEELERMIAWQRRMAGYAK